MFYGIIAVTVNEQKPDSKPAANTPSTPDWAVHISKVYAWGEQARPFGGKMTKRTIQWYSSTGLIPSPTRHGKEAYYDKRVIFNYLRVIEILNRKFGLLLGQIQRILQAVNNLADEETGQLILGFDDEGDSYGVNPVEALAKLLEGYLVYEQNEASLCDQNIDGPDWSPEQRSRLQTLEQEIVKRLQGDPKTLEALITHNVITLETALFPQGKKNTEEPF